MHSIYIIIINYKELLSILHSQLCDHCHFPKNIAMIFDIMVVHLLQYPSVLQLHVDCFVSCQHSPNHLTMVCPAPPQHILCPPPHACWDPKRFLNSSRRLLYLGIFQRCRAPQSKPNCPQKCLAPAHTSTSTCPRIYEMQIYCL